MKRRIFFAGVSITLLVAHFSIGTPITLFLSICIIACFAYYILNLYSEKNIGTAMQNGDGQNPAFRKFLQYLRNKRFVVLSISLLLVVFMSSLYCIKKTINPTSHNPWFLNIDHHAIRNTAIQFENKLDFTIKNEDSISKPEGITLIESKGNYILQTEKFYKPIFQELEKNKYVPINNILPQSITRQFEISNTGFKLIVDLANSSNRVWYKPWVKKHQTKYKVTVKCTDANVLQELGLPTKYVDSFSFSDISLVKGLTLQKLFLQKDILINPITQQILQNILNDLGDTYLLVHHAGDQKSFRIFPSENFVENDYTLTVEGLSKKVNDVNTFSIGAEKLFYFGLGGKNEKMYLSKLHGKNALVFDFPQAYLLSNAGKVSVGTKSSRFISNTLTQVVNGNLQEGYFFNNNNLSTSNSVDGVIQFVADRTSNALNYAVTDNKSINREVAVTNNSFILNSNNGSINYVFDIINFANNGFAYNKILLYCIYLFLLFAAVLIFARGLKLERIEPVIWVCIYALLVLRFILYWRVATFPPLVNISKHELQNTLIGFDFHFFGMELPVPLTLIFVTIIAVCIVMYRKWGSPTLSMPVFLKKYFLNFKWNEVQILNATYILFLVACLSAFIILPWEITKRLTSILFPLLAYCYASIKAGALHQMPKILLNSVGNVVSKYVKALLHYLIHNPTFYITFSTICFFAIVDRGFCIVFVLFIMLKNILLNFSKKSYDAKKETLLNMFLSPRNFWIYAVLSLLIYFVVLSFKSLFYYILTYKLIFIAIFMLLCLVLLTLFYKHKKRLYLASGTLSILYLICILIPSSRNYLDEKITDKIKHVHYRASIIHQPISNLLAQNAFSSFSTQKIIETAENQWFINSYITKDLDRTSPLNLRAFTKVGVNYNTQTRDVVLARFVISEMGGYAMALILCLFVLPLFIYLLSYKIRNPENSTIFIKESYAGLLPLVFLFTISLFVWLTSTNRFVFFGQDFPFLSLTSRLSVLLPLILYAMVLVRQPKAYNALSLNLSLGISRYLALILAIIIFSYSTFKNNNLKEGNFNAVVQSTQFNIDQKFNAILSNIQDSLQQKKVRYNYNSLCKIVQANQNYLQFKSATNSDAYTNSVLEAWEQNEGTAMRVNNPMYLRFDKGRYYAQYNKTLYIAQPVTENKLQWHGRIVGQQFESNSPIVFQYNNVINNIQLPYVVNDGSLSGIDVAILPANWFVNNANVIGLINVQNQYRNKVNLLVQKENENNQMQNASTFVSTIWSNDKVLVQSNNKTFEILFTEPKPVFAYHKWVNNEYRSIYPLRENYFYPYNFTNTVRTAYSKEINSESTLTLDFDLLKTVQTNIQKTYTSSQKRNTQFAFSVIAADGDGNIRMMNDYVKNRKIIDPNDKASLYKLNENHFFYSNAKNERDQWGNINLLNLHLGPGSSIKPIIVAAISSQVNAGWEFLNYLPDVKADKEYYAGLKLAQPWTDDEHYFGAAMDIPTYLQHSSNFFHSVMMFLGSYRKSDFGDTAYSITNILKHQGDKKNTFPLLQINGMNYMLPNFNNGKNNWPISDASKTVKSYFANENSILANGLSVNLNLPTSDKDKLDGSVSSTRPTYFVDTFLHKKLLTQHTSQYLWSFPEASIFSQKMRHFISSKKKNEINENFNLGLKSATLGGYPYQITPFKMLEMYNALFTLNRNYEMHITPKQVNYTQWSVDSSWQMQNYKTFIATNIFEGMKRVITAGTATSLKNVTNKFPQYYFYAKTGTINEAGGGQANSRRLVVTITNKDMTIPENIGSAKVYSFYFVIDNNRDFDWNLVNQIISDGIQSNSFLKYFSNAK
jgi:hypothetical protein